MSSPPVVYLICTTARTGSNHLCSLLEHTGVAGMRCDPHVHYERLRVPVAIEARTRRAARRELAATIKRRLEGSATPNGVTGFKLMWLHIEQLRHRGWSEGDFIAALPSGTRLVWLHREDRVRQAISWVKAEQSNLWSSDSPLRFSGRYVYDHARIHAMVATIERHERAWRRFFERWDLHPLELSYEQIVADREHAIRRVLDHIQVPVPEELSARDARYARQADSLSDHWWHTYHGLEAGGVVARRAHLVRHFPRHVVLRLLSVIRLRRRDWQVSRAVRAADPAAPRPRQE